MSRIHLLLLLCFSCCWFFSRIDAAGSAMSVDLGTEFMKMALIKPGVPMEIVLNRESHRKTPFALTVRQQERFFGDESLKKSISTPKHTFTFFLDLIGKKFTDPVVAAYQRQFPYLQLKPNDQRGTVNFVTEAGELPIETMLAMVLAYAATEVATYAGQPVKDVVIAVPAHFGQSERKAIEAAAQIAGLNPIQLMSAGASAGLNYGVFRYKEITEEPQTYLIYDVGSTKVQATIIRYQTFNDTETTTTNAAVGPIPRLEVTGYGFDTESGGHQLTLKLRDLLVDEFRKKNPGSDIATSPQAMAKLLKEAGRVKQVLSANSETFAQVESVYQDIDFKTKVTRQQLEEMFRENEERMMAPIGQAMEMAKLGDKETLDKVLLMGAGTRVPRLQELLGQFFAGKQLGRNLNTDEAIALGAVYQAARFSKNFRVKRFDVVDSEPPQPIEEMVAISQEEIDQAKKILGDFEKLEKAKADRDHALHTLESTVFDYIYKLEEEEFKKFGTNEELESISKALAELREWLEEIPAEMTAAELKEKRRELMKPIRKLKNRRQQKEERPEQMAYLEKNLEEANKQLGLFRNTTEIFTPTELDNYEKLIVDTLDWNKNKKVEAEKLADSQDASFTADDLKSKANMLKLETKSLFRKMIIAIKLKEEKIKAEEAALKKEKEEEELKKRKEEEEASKAKEGEETSEGKEQEKASEGKEEEKASEGKEEEKASEGKEEEKASEGKEEDKASEGKEEEKASEGKEEEKASEGKEEEKASEGKEEEKASEGKEEL